MNTDELITRRIAQIRREICNGNNALFANRIGKSRQHASALCSGKSKAGKLTLELILAAFPTVNREWLYFGTDQMLDAAPFAPLTDSNIYADIADTFAHLSHLYSQLSLCVSKSE